MKTRKLERKKTIKPKLIVILGPTATGKTKLAVRLAHKYNGEIISADSRQVYRGMDIGTGKDLDDYVIKARKQESKKTRKQEIKYHLIDIVSPKTDFSVAKYQKLTYEAIADVLARGKTPFLVGGTGLYIDAVTQGYRFPITSNVKHVTKKLRKELAGLTLSQLLAKLKKIDPKTYKIIDKKNRRRVERAMEIYYQSGVPKSEQPGNIKPGYDILFLGVKLRLEKIYQKIDKRLEKRIEEGMIAEVKRLKRQGVSSKRLEDFGLEYRYLARYLRGQIDYQTFLLQLKTAIHHFAKRQMTWFKRNNNIIWINSLATADKQIKKFLKT